jgi:transcriptional regulator with XRE-family HTH domain
MAQKEKITIPGLLRETMRKKRRLASQLAEDIGVSHASVSRWLSGKDLPGTGSCGKLAEYSGISLQKILAAAGHVPESVGGDFSDLPEFREYACLKYPRELNEDIIATIEELIERKRNKMQMQSSKAKRSK